MEKEHSAVVTRPKLCLPASRRINTLVREGNSGMISKNARSDSEVLSPKYFTKTKMGAGSDKKIKLEDQMFYKYVLMNPQYWSPLGNSWYQFTPQNSGNSSHCGLHTIIECGKHIYGCLYEPQTTLGHMACITGNANALTQDQPAGANVAGVEFNLEVSLKHMKAANVGSGIIFGFKNIFNFCMLICDVPNKLWELVVVVEEHYNVIRESVDPNIKENAFQNVLMQIRNDCVSVDVNGRGVFTSVRMSVPGSVTATETLNGLLGVVCKQSKVIMKGWRISRPASMPPPSNTALAFGTPSSVSPVRVIPVTPAVRPQAQTEIAGMNSSTTSNSRRPRSLADMLAERSHSAGAGAGAGSLSQAPTAAVAPVTVPRRGPPPVPYGGGGPSSATASIASTGTGVSTSVSANVNSAANNVGIESRDTSEPNQNLSQYNATLATARDAIRHIYEEDLRHTEGDTAPPPAIAPSPGALVAAEESASSSSLADAASLQQLRSHLHGLMHSTEIVDSILRDIILPSSISTTFQDIGALSKAKQILQEAVILPVLLPELFVGLREPWKGVLFGPPGTGKTLLAKAVASLSSSTFINCSSATILCKYRGDSEKTIKCLFDAARACTPSILFIDEIDGLVGHKSNQNSEHEATRRLKTEFFTQMDGLSTTVHKTTSINANSKSNSVLVLATTNTPWELDEALRRRFEKRIYIALPNNEARTAIFQLYLEKMVMDEATAAIEGSSTQTQCDLSSGDIETLAALSEGYSGADIYNVCREASMIPLRRLMLSVSNPMDLALMKAQGKIVVPKVRKCSNFMGVIVCLY